MKLFTITALMAGSSTVLAGLGDMQIDFPFVPVPVVFPRASTQNLQEFPGALGGAAADPVTASGDPTRPFEVDGETFTDYSDAQMRSCNNQHNTCANIANSKSNPDGITTTQCDAQQTTCLTFTTPASPGSPTSASPAATTTSTGAQVLKSEDANFYYFCDT